MRFSWAVVLGLTLGAQANRLAPRQNGGTTAPPPGTTSGGGGDTSSSSSSGGGGGSDTTVTVTATVTGEGGSTVSDTTTVIASSVTTVTVTTTDIATTTITKSDGDTSTKTVYVTSTQTVNMKRSLDGTFEYLGNGPAQVDAEPTPAPTVTGIQAGYPGIEKRAIITTTVTVTAGGSGATTVFQTVTKNVKSTTTTVVHATSLVTETYQANAKTTVTVTSTIVSKLTVVSTGVIETSTSTPTGGAGSGGGSSDGLSTGAKAGIGVGAGVAGLAIIGALLWFCRRRSRGPKPDPDDLLGPSSEVPVGAGSSRHSRPMSEGLTSTPGTAPRRSPVLPNVQVEGYRGTAMGDGRAGYAKPDPYGAAYAPTRSTTNSTHPSRGGTLSPGDQLPRHPTPETTAASVSPLSPRPQTAELGNDGAGAKWHTSEAAEMATDNPAAAKWHSDNAHEIDSQPVMGHQSGPVYEMPTEHFK
ncbi:hypothetical protein VFPPC_14292 [Pochonia chlamydosporia 170]|uniref:Uncharacterized protein n=1 Tax=Pochonia chlamydosporia 170 TaxID=1380566 RepID=A0A179FLP8_METCM|nr:hypothetical protein VFPPC_14292 [Pochonia chlamydosporia 170]OAQ66150.1 hypothetical protein VFPPC_14292 [Pochonia chlamydosporia 170]